MAESRTMTNFRSIRALLPTWLRKVLRSFYILRHLVTPQYSGFLLISPVIFAVIFHVSAHGQTSSLDPISAGLKSDAAAEQDVYPPEADPAESSTDDIQPSHELATKSSHKASRKVKKPEPKKEQVLSRLSQALSHISKQPDLKSLSKHEVGYCKKLRLSFPVAEHEDVIVMHQLCNAIIYWHEKNIASATTYYERSMSPSGFQRLSDKHQAVFQQAILKFNALRNTPISACSETLQAYYYPYFIAARQRFLAITTTTHQSLPAQQEDNTSTDLVSRQLNMPVPWIYLPPNFLPPPYVAAPAAYHLDDSLEQTATEQHLKRLLSVRFKNKNKEVYEPETKQWIRAEAGQTVSEAQALDASLSSCIDNADCHAWLLSNFLTYEQHKPAAFYDVLFEELPPKVQTVMFYMGTRAAFPAEINQQIRAEALARLRTSELSQEFLTGPLTTLVHTPTFWAAHYIKNTWQAEDEKLLPDAWSQLLRASGPSLSPKSQRTREPSELINSDDNLIANDILEARRFLSNKMSPADCRACRCLEALKAL